MTQAMVHVHAISRRAMCLRRAGLGGRIKRTGGERGSGAIGRPTHNTNHHVHRHPATRLQTSTPEQATQARPTITRLPQQLIPRSEDQSSSSKQRRPFTQRAKVSLPRTQKAPSPEYNANSPRQPTNTQFRGRPTNLIQTLILPSSNQEAPSTH